MKLHPYLIKFKLKLNASKYSRKEMILTLSIGNFQSKVCRNNETNELATSLPLNGAFEGLFRVKGLGKTPRVDIEIVFRRGNVAFFLPNRK